MKSIRFWKQKWKIALIIEQDSALHDFAFWSIQALHLPRAGPTD
jgi:hypothetical protein